jgi:hypothetical protein
MTAPQRKAVARHRKRLRRQGLVRLEVQALRGDAALIRRIASALRRDVEGSGIRAHLNQAIGGEGPPGLKALLASAPLEGVELERSRTLPRRTDL